MCPSSYRVSGPPSPGGGGGRTQTCTKDRWGCACKISLRLVQGFGFPLALHIPTDIQTNICMPIYIYVLAEVLGTARVNMQPAEHLCPPGFRVSGHPGPGVGEGDQTWIKTFLEQVGMCMQNFIKIGAGVWISINPPHTNRQTNKQTSVHPFYI